MDIAVFISGVADPKWPLPQDISVASLQAHASRHAALSPFDEAALEISLALRDTDPDLRITAFVAADEALTRRVAGWRPDKVVRIDLEDVDRWDGGAVSTALWQAATQHAPDASLLLIGREFGDFDDGTVPAGLALKTARTFLTLALTVRMSAGVFEVLRQGAAGLERVRVSAPTLLSATNDPGNRVRHPLMKNVMVAKKAVFEVWRAPDPAAARSLKLDAVALAAAPARNADCQWIVGSAEEKARALALALNAAVQA
jgi:electron transfer flavoprotein beta subunit